MEKQALMECLLQHRVPVKKKETLSCSHTLNSRKSLEKRKKTSWKDYLSQIAENSSAANWKKEAANGRNIGDRQSD
jgi:hypothetical protein